MLVTGLGMWTTIAVGIFAMSFVPDLVHVDVQKWRIMLGIPVLILLVSMATWFRRLGDRQLYWATFFACCAPFAALIALLHATSATMAMLSDCFAASLFGAYFFKPRHAIAVLLLMSSVAATVLVMDPVYLQPHVKAYIAVFIPVLWAVTITVAIQRHDLLTALTDARNQAFTDPLTGLANLRGLRKHADALMSPLKDGSRRGVGLLLIDLDSFKRANSLHGHLGGDHALRIVADQLRRAATRESYVARIGGDEFAVVLADISQARLSEYADLFRGAVRGARPAMKLPDVHIDATVGTAIFPRDGETIDDLLTVAGKSLYLEKGKRAPSEFEEPADLESAPIDRDTLRWNAYEPEHEETAVRGGAFVRRLISLPGYARFAGIAWLLGSASLLFSMAMPDADRSYETIVLIGSLGGLGTAMISPWVLPKAGSAPHVVVDLFCFATVAAAIWLTGGSDSQALPMIYLVVVYQSLFLGTRAILFRLIAPLAVVLTIPIYEDFTASPNVAVTIITLYAHLLAAWMITIVMSSVQTYLLRARRKSQRLAATDPLTSLANRRAFKSRVESELAAISAGESQQLAIVMIDLDNFKDVNTLQGHRAGDFLLAEIAQALAEATRSDDFIARIGGDEFAAVLTGTDSEQATVVAQRFVDAVMACTSSQRAAASARVTASAGVAVYPDSGRSLDGLMLSADRALMEAKKAAHGKDERRPPRVFASAS